MNILSTLVGKVVVVVLLIAMVIGGIAYYNRTIEQETIREQKIESVQKELEVRRKVDEILRENQTSNPDRDGYIALDRLRKQYQGSN